MRKVLFICCLICSIYPVCNAQNSSRVFFYRIDRMGDNLYYNLFLRHNNRVINNFKNRSIYIFNSDSTGGTYRWSATSLVGKKYDNKITLTERKNSIAFVELKLAIQNDSVNSNATQISMKVISPDEFKKDYNQKKWLRRKMAKSGYKTIDNLTIGYKMYE